MIRRTILALLALLALIAFADHASAWPVIRGVYGLAKSCPYSVDNGCAASQTYASAPYFQDVNFTVDSAQSGQLPASPTALQIAVRKGLMHQNAQNQAYVDYAVGSNNPATLTPITSWVNDSVCTYHPAATFSATITGNQLSVSSVVGTITIGDNLFVSTTAGSTSATISSGSGSTWTISTSLAYPSPTAMKSGYIYNGIPWLSCGGTAAPTSAVERISGYDFTAGGTQSTGVQMGNVSTGGGNIAAPTYIFTNDYILGGGYGAPVYFSGGSTGAAPPDLQMYNVTCDGNYANAQNINPPVFTANISGTSLTVTSGPTNPIIVGQFISGGTLPAGEAIAGGSGSAWTLTISGGAQTGITVTGSNAPIWGRYGCVQDNRSDASGLPYNFSREIYYSVFQDMGSDPYTGGTSGNSTWAYNYVGNICNSGITLCHGEVEELTGGSAFQPTYRRLTYLGNTILVPASQGTGESYNSVFYLSSGNNANNITDDDVENNLIIINKSFCTNSADYTDYPLYGYGPNNACSGLYTAGNGFFNTNYVTSVPNFTLTGNIVDGSGANVCYSNSHNVLTNAVASSSGAILNITTPATNFSNNVSAPYSETYPNQGAYNGMWITNSNSGYGFNLAIVSSFGTYSNIPTFTGTINGTNLVTDVPVNLIPGNVVYGSNFKTSYGTVVSGSGTNWTLSASNNTADIALGSGNNTSTCVPGQNGGCGTLNLSTTEPTLSGVTGWITYASIGNTTVSNNWSIGGSSYPTTARAITLPTPFIDYLPCP